MRRITFFMAWGALMGLCTATWGMEKSSGTGATVCRPVALACEHLNRPLGIDNPSPRLSWQLAD